MRKIILLVTIIAATAVLSNAQEPENIPTAPATPVVRDDDIRLRSVEMERIRKEAAKNEGRQSDSESVTLNTEIDKKYPEIKEDFEGMQLSQAAIIKAYTTGDEIDYAVIESSAGQINKNAKRLDSNLFDNISEEKSDEAVETKAKKETKTIRDMIIALDKAIGDVIGSKMFLNLRVIEPEVAQKTQVDLEKVLTLSVELSEAAKKMK